MQSRTTHSMQAFCPLRILIIEETGRVILLSQRGSASQCHAGITVMFSKGAVEGDKRVEAAPGSGA